MKSKFMKIFSLVMIFALTAAMFVGCGSDNAENTSDGETKETLIMATNAEFPPYEFYEGEKVVGIDAEIAQAIADKLGMDLKIEDMAFDSIITAVTSGKATFGMAGMTITEDRLVSVDFSTPYTTAVQSIIVPEGSEITKVEDLTGDKNYTIGVQNATTGDIYATGDIEDEGLGTVERYTKGADAVEALLAGKIDCVIIDNQVAKNFVAANDGLVLLDTAYAEEEYAICFAKDGELNDAINTALEELIADGTVQSIIDKYITE